ncbi:hypothetical protein WA158_008257 [Blastocystis sp. Blastoise]
MRKICDILQDAKENNKKIYSFEIFPPRTEQGMINLFTLIGKFKEEHNPQFIDVTWGAGGSTANTTFDICKRIQDEFGIIANLHITCTNVKIEEIRRILDKCKEDGINNIFCLRGDPPKDVENWVPPEGGFSSARDLVAWVRKEYGDYFCISVAGYPEGHPNTIKVVDSDVLTASEKKRACMTSTGLCVCSDDAYEQELCYLKEKVEAGADVIITQMFFDAQLYIDFVDDCSRHNIHIPILPGILCPINYGGFFRMVSMNKSRVPTRVWNTVLPYKDDETKLRECFIDIVVEQSQRILMSDHQYLHFFVLNSNKLISRILDALHLDGSPAENADFSQGLTETSDDVTMIRHTIMSNSYDVSVIEKRGIKPTFVNKLDNIEENRE